MSVVVGSPIVNPYSVSSPGTFVSSPTGVFQPAIFGENPVVYTFGIGMFMLFIITIIAIIYFLFTQPNEMTRNILLVVFFIGIFVSAGSSFSQSRLGMFEPWTVMLYSLTSIGSVAFIANAVEAWGKIFGIKFFAY